MSNSSDSGTPLAGLRTLASRNPATERLMDVGQQYLMAKAQDLVGSAGARLGEATKQAGTAPGKIAQNLGGRVVGSVKDAVTGLAGKAKGAADKGKGDKGSGGPGPVTIVEDIDVGVPVEEAYDQWTRFEDFSRFTKGVVGVDQTDETTSNWRVKVAKSTRSWTATITEQVPDERIAWTSEGAKGITKGVVTFHPLGDNLTKVLVVLEYYPKGFVEKTGNLWRAQGRRVRLDLKHFRRHLMLQGEAGGPGRREEIRDGEVVQDRDEDSDDREESEGDYDEDDYDQDDYDEEDEPDEEEDEEEDDYDRDEDDRSDEDEEPERGPDDRARKPRAGAGRGGAARTRQRR